MVSHLASPLVAHSSLLHLRLIKLLPLVLGVILCASACGSLGSTINPKTAPTPTVDPLQPTMCSSSYDIPAKDDFTKLVGNYVDLIFHRLDGYKFAFAMLSKELQRQVTLSQFQANEDYTLFRPDPGCWSILRLDSSLPLRNGTTWQLGLLLVFVPRCGSGKQYYYWLFQIRKQGYDLVISKASLSVTKADPPCEHAPSA